MLILDEALEGGFEDRGVDATDDEAAPRTRTGLLHTAPL